MSRYAILGGTGTLGRALTKRLLENETYDEVICFSRCELKQKQMQADFENNPRLHFILGDIRDISALHRAFLGVHTVFHCAALKHVDVLEANPEESVKTNILGTVNVADAAEAACVPYVVFSSTDKAVAPVNAYGMCKAISEKILLQRNVPGNRTRFSVFRWGNVVSSRGSVIPTFIRTLKETKTAYITHPDMTRFWITIQEAVDFMLSHYQTAPVDKPLIPPIRAARVGDVIAATARVLKITDYTVKTVGTRAGEKLHEELAAGMCSNNWATYSGLDLEQLVRDTVTMEMAQCD